MSGRSLRYGLLALLVALQVATLTSVYLWSRWRSESVLRDHQSELVEGIAAGSADRTDRFLQRAEGVLELTADLVAAGVVDLGRADVAEQYFLSLLRERPGLAGVFVGYDDGAFLFVNRRDDGFLTKTITVDGGRVVSLVERTADSRVTSTSFDPDDTYDPRQRPWYQAASDSSGVVWTSPYVFFTSQLPGVSAAKSLYDPTGLPAGVLGIDVTLSQVAEFLDVIPVTENGRAFVVGPDDAIVAYPGDTELAIPRDDADGYRLRTLAEIESDVVRLAYESALAAPDQATNDAVEFEYDGQTHLVRLQPLESASGWTVAVTAPEDDLVGAIRDDRRDVFLIALAVALGLGLLAVPLVFGLTRPVAVLQERATTDALTSLPNRREFFDRAEELAERSARTGTPLAVAMVDVDRFKVVNDTFGHVIGDEVLRAIAGRMRSHLRPRDLVGRYGGEEFAVVMPDTDGDVARTVLERIIVQVAADPIRTDAEVPIRVTLSAGVAEGDPDLTSLLRRADFALLHAKSQGRNRVEVSVRGERLTPTG